MAVPVKDEPPVVCRLDIAPATLVFRSVDTGTEETIQQTRVIVTVDRVYVFRDGRPPYEWYSARIESFEGRNTTGWQVVTAGGDILTFRRGGGCLCGSQLKSFRPFSQGLVQGPYDLT